MTHFGLEITCPYCAGPVVWVNSATQGLLSLAIVECQECDRQLEVTIRLAPHQDPERHRASNRKSMARARARTSDTASV
jgi:endogenous inhibitor of DNA gyrase (YacG/DUF329 family)